MGSMSSRLEMQRFGPITSLSFRRSCLRRFVVWNPETGNGKPTGGTLSFGDGGVKPSMKGRVTAPGPA